MEVATAGIGIFMILLYGVGFIFVLVALIYLIAKRIDDKKREDFEKRSN